MSLFGKDSKGLFGKSSKPKVIKTTKVQDLTKSNQSMTKRIEASGVESPVKPKGPQALDRIFGVLDTLGAGTRSLAYNAVSDKDVNPLEEMGKALKGQDRIEGSDILKEMGVENKWGQMLGGIALDIALDPITYLTTGLSTIVKAEAAVRMAKLADTGADLAKLTDAGVDIGKLSSGVQDALKSGAVLKAVDFDPADTRKIVAAIRKTVGKEFGDRGGVKLAGVSLGGQSGMEKAANVTKDALRKVTGSEWFERAFVWGDATGLAREGNELVNAGVKQSLRKLSAGRTKAGVAGSAIERQIRELVPDETARMGLTLGMSNLFGRYTEQGTLRAANEAVEAAIKGGDRAAIDAAEDIALAELKKAYNPAAIREAVERIGITDPAQLAQIDSAAKLIEGNFDTLLKAKGAVGLSDTALYHGAEDVAGSAAAGYVPGSLPIAPTKASEKASGGVLDTLGIDAAGLAAPDNTMPLMAKLKGMGKVGAEKSKEYRTIEERLVEGGLITELDIAKLSGAKTTKDYAAIALQDFRDDIGKMLGVSADAIEQASPEMARLFAGAQKAFTDDEAFKGALGAYDKFLNLWKRWATVYNLPRFPARNGLSNKFLQFLEGVFDPTTEAEGARIAALIAKGGKGADDKTMKLIDELYTHGVVTTQAQLSEQVGAKLAKSSNKVAAGYEAIAGGVNEFVENQSRVAAYLAAIKKGASPEAAGMMVDKALYNYSPEALTSFERNVMKRLVPFWTWTSQNAPHMAEVLGKTPGKLAAVFHAKEVGQSVNPVDESVMPDWLGALNAIPTPLKDAAGNTRMVATEGVLPIGDLERLLTPALSPKEAPREALGMLSPLIKTPLELIFNKDLYYDDPISNYKGDSRRVPAYIEKFDDLVTALLPEEAKGWEAFKDTFGIVEKTSKDGEPYLAANALAMKALKDLNPWLNAMGKMMADQSKTPDDRLSYLTGVKTVNYDTEAFKSQKEADDYQELRGVIARLKAEGKLADTTKQKAVKPSKLKSLLGGE